MNDRTKKILFAIVFVLASIGIGWMLYYFFFQPLIQPETISTEEQTPPLGSLPSAGEATDRPPTATSSGGGLTGSPTIPGLTDTGIETPPSNAVLLRDGITQSLAPSMNGQGARFYNPDDSRFYRVNTDGSITTLGDKQFFNLKNVDWGNRSDKAILEFPDGSNVFYDFETRRQVTLPQHWQDFTFSPDDENIAAKSIGLDPSNRFLLIAKADGNEAKAIEPLGQNADKTLVSWSPNNQVIAFALTGTPQPEGAQEVLLVGENHENFKSLIVPGRGFLPNWSPTGRQIVYSVYHERDSLKPSLWIAGGAADDIGENRRRLNLNTWADKCVWESEEALICGVPQQLELGAGLARDRFASVPDDLYRVDLRTGVSTKINTPAQIYPIKNPVLNKDSNQLLFSDAVTGRLYRYDLNP